MNPPHTFQGPFLILAMLVLSGCMTAPRETAEPRYGLGLEIPSQLPPPGPYLEGSAVVHAFRQKVQAMLPQVLQACGANVTTAEIRKALDLDPLYAGVYGVYGQCQGDISAEANRIAREAKRNGTEEETYAHYVAQAKASLEREIALLDAAPTGGTVAEVEMVSKLQSEVLGRALAFETIQGWMDHYLNVSRDEFDLSNVFINLMSYETTTKRILDTYEWTNSTCHIPNQDQLEQRVKDKLEHAIELARKWDNPETPEASNAYGTLTQSFQPMIAFASEHDWWQLLLRDEMEMDHIIAEYETQGADALPTPEEARYLVALYWNQSRNLVFQDRLDSLADQMEYALGGGWYEDDLRPRMALGLAQVEWTYSQVICNPQ